MSRRACLLAATTLTLALSTGCGSPGPAPAAPAPAAATSSAPAASVASDLALPDEAPEPMAPTAPGGPEVTIKLLVDANRKAHVFWGRKDLGLAPLEIRRPRGSGPLDLLVIAPGFLPLHTRAFTDRDDTLSLRLYDEEAARGLLGHPIATDVRSPGASGGASGGASDGASSRPSNRLSSPGVGSPGRGKGKGDGKGEGVRPKTDSVRVH